METPKMISMVQVLKLTPEQEEKIDNIINQLNSEELILLFSELRFNEEVRESYSRYERIVADHNAFVIEFEEECERRYKIGFEKGMREETLRIAKCMLDDGMPVEEVSQIVELPIEDIKNLQQ